MFKYSVPILTVISTALTVILKDMITIWYDFWKVIVVFLGYSVVYVALAFVFAFIMSLFVRIKDEPVEKPSKLYRFMMEQFLDMFLVLARVKVTVFNKELIPTDRRFLFIMNHKSKFDQLTICSALKGYEISWIAKPSLFKAPIGGPFMYNIGCLAIVRENPRDGVRVINEAAKRIASDVCNIGVTPEGTRVKDDELLEYKPGSLKIAKKALCPIVVCSVANTNYVQKRWPLKSTKVYFDIIKVIEPVEYENMNTTEIADLCRELTIKSLEKTRKNKI